MMRQFLKFIIAQETIAYCKLVMVNNQIIHISPYINHSKMINFNNIFCSYMYKALFFCALVLLVSSQMTGGFKEITPNKLQQLRQEDETFQRADALARETYEAEHDGELGRIIKAYEQTVSGVNYKMLYETDEGAEEVVVYCQPWTDTYRVLSMKPYTQSH